MVDVEFHKYTHTHTISHSRIDSQSNRFQSKRTIWGYDRWIDDVPTKLFPFYLCAVRSMGNWHDNGASTCTSQTLWDRSKWEKKGLRSMRRGEEVEQSEKYIAGARACLVFAEKIRPCLCFRDEDDWWVGGTKHRAKKKRTKRPRLFEAGINPLCKFLLRHSSILLFCYYRHFFSSRFCPFFFLARFDMYLQRSQHDYCLRIQFLIAEVLRRYVYASAVCLEHGTVNALRWLSLMCTTSNKNISLQRRAAHKNSN